MQKYAIFYDITRFSEYDIYLFKEGKNYKLYEKFGSHFMQRDREEGVYFATWAPNAEAVHVRGDFNNYSLDAHPLKKREDDSGIWEGFIVGITEEMTYKYYIKTHEHNANPDKADPYAFYAEVAPNSSSKVYKLDAYKWHDAKWMKNRHKNNSQKSPISIYEVHLGSWRRKVEEGNRVLTYEESAYELAEYVKEMNFTHVELLPITEFPYEGSWGYQVTGYFAPTARYGTPHDFMKFVDIMHKSGIGVILDWVPSHFVTDGHGLMNFDGTSLYEHKDPRKGYHPEWGSAIFNYDRNEVRAFLGSSALFWLEMYHLDGIRVDGVASMLYLDYAREEGEWIPNEDGSNVNRGAVQFLSELNSAVQDEYNDIIMVAEESTNYSKVSFPVSDGGLGFDYKWNMGWMHDILKYMKFDPYFRQHHHEHLTFSFVYMYKENYILPLSHDEVVHMKGSLINKMPGENPQKFANLRALFSLMIAHPGKKLLFMGGEFAQFAEWNYTQSLDWHLVEQQEHKQMQELVKTLNKLYKNESALHRHDTHTDGFEWIDERDYQANVISFIRKGAKNRKPLIIVCNFSGKVHNGYEIGLPSKGVYEEIFCSEDEAFGGLGAANPKSIKSTKQECHGRENMLKIDLAPLSVSYFKRVKA